MESEYRSTYKGWFDPHQTMSNPTIPEQMVIPQNQIVPNLTDNKIDKVEGRFDTKYLMNRYFKFHPEHDKIDFRKKYNMVKTSQEPKKTTYSECFKKEGASLPKFSNYLEAVNGMAQIFEDEQERRKFFDKEIRQNEPEIPSGKNFTEDQSINIVTEEVIDENDYDYTPSELAMYAIRELRKNRYHNQFN